jgi:hypothetical protein
MALLTAGACLVCWKPGERAHLIDRSLFPDPHSDPRRVVPLCREHHTAYDDHTLDLLPLLEPRHRSELARAVEIHGLIGTLERVTGRSWAPTDHSARSLARASEVTA